MKKSERYTMAVLCVLEDGILDGNQKIEVLETLMEDRKVALWSEKEEKE